MTFLGRYLSLAWQITRSGDWRDEPSLVIKLMNSLTHSCMHSLASFAILAFSGKAIFMILATGAKLRMLASDPLSDFLLDLDVRRVCGSGEDDPSDMI